MGCSNSKRSPASGSPVERCRMLSVTGAAATMHSRHIAEELTEEQVEELWPKFIQDMDITADRAHDMAAMDADKKLQVVQNWLSSKQQPGQATCTAGYYVGQLRALLAGSGRCCERQGLLKGLENCLRSYSVQWLEEFMDNGGLDLLLEYLGRALDSLINSEEPLLNGHSERPKRSCWRRLSVQCSSRAAQQQQQQQQQQQHQQQQWQQPDESLLCDLHNGVKCMRVLFNNQRACQRTFQDKTAINIIAQCVLHPRYATKTLVLELLAALCMLEGMHSHVLDAFDCLRERVGERRRWETLMACFRRHDSLPPEQYSLEFMVSCARFINIVQNVSNDEQLGMRVLLQAEFAQLGLEDFLRGLHGKYGDERLNSQIEAISDNTIDVAGLFIDSVAKQAAVARAAALEEELYQAQDRQRRAEDEAAQSLAELRERLHSSEAD